MKESNKKQFIKIRDTRADDAERIISVRRDAWLSAYPSKEAKITYNDIEEKVNQEFRSDKIDLYRERLKSKNKCNKWMVAEIDNTIVGYSYVEKKDHKRIIQVLNVHPDYFGAGVGQALLDKAIEWLGSDSVELSVVKHNFRAIKFYQKNGFHIVGDSNDEVAKLPSGKEMQEWRMVKKTYG